MVYSYGYWELYKERGEITLNSHLVFHIPLPSSSSHGTNFIATTHRTCPSLRVRPQSRGFRNIFIPVIVIHANHI